MKDDITATARRTTAPSHVTVILGCLAGILGGLSIWWFSGGTHGMPLAITAAGGLIFYLLFWLLFL